jgi:hypothetical protein
MIAMPLHFALTAEVNCGSQLRFWPFTLGDDGHDTSLDSARDLLLSARR